MSLDRPVAPDPYALLPEVGSFTLSSPDIRSGEAVDLDFVYGPDAPGGANRSPRAALVRIPGGHPSRSCVSCFDPDAPTPSGFWHWTVVDIPAAITELEADAGNPNRDNLPDGAFHVANDFGTVGYDGPTPPPGDQVHRYFFVVHAVDMPDPGPRTVGQRHGGVVQPRLSHPGPGHPRPDIRLLTAVADFDLVLIGTGSGNSIPGPSFADWRIAVVEAGDFGGTCLNVGCIPTKMFVYPADVAEAASGARQLGLRTTFDGIDWPSIRDRVFRRVDDIERRGRAYRKGPKSQNTTVFEGWGRFTGPRSMSVAMHDGSCETFTARPVRGGHGLAAQPSPTSWAWTPI